MCPVCRMLQLVYTPSFLAEFVTMFSGTVSGNSELCYHDLTSFISSRFHETLCQKRYLYSESSQWKTANSIFLIGAIPLCCINTVL